MIEEQQQDEGFDESVRLMLFGGLLLLVCIVGGNKLIYHHFMPQPEKQAALNGLIDVESSVFRMHSYPELYLTWGFFIISVIGLISIIHRLVKTWNH